MSTPEHALAPAPEQPIVTEPRERLISPETWRWMKAAAVLCCLVPITILVGLRFARWSTIRCWPSTASSSCC